MSLRFRESAASIIATTSQHKNTNLKIVFRDAEGTPLSVMRPIAD